LSNHLRFTPDDYRALCHACDALPLSGPYAAFQRGISDALRPSHPALAKQIRRMNKRQVRTLRMHLETRNSPNPRPPVIA
jgi:hypothetical protein